MKINKALLGVALGLALKACETRTSSTVERYRQKMLEFIEAQKGDNRELEDRLIDELDAIFFSGSPEEKEEMLAMKFEMNS